MPKESVSAEMLFVESDVDVQGRIEPLWHFVFCILIAGRIIWFILSYALCSCVSFLLGTYMPPAMTSISPPMTRPVTLMILLICFN